MLINQHFAQSQAKSLEPLAPVSISDSVSCSTQGEIQAMEYEQAQALLQNTMARIDGAYSPSTIRAYRANFAVFIRYCEEQKASPLPSQPETVTKFIAHLSKGHLQSASIRIAIVAIAAIHRLNRFDDPTKDPDVALEVRRMYRKLGRASKQALGVTQPILEKLIGVTDDSLRGIRDRMLLLLAYDSLCRRSELVSLRIEDISKLGTDKGLQIRLRKSKTDPNAMGKWLHLSERTQRAIEEWINLSGIREGFLIRRMTKHGGILPKGISGGHINRIYKHLAAQAKLDSKMIEHISGHSMRVGSAQDLMTSGASMPMLMNRGRWTKTDTVMRYVENAQVNI
jgi:site-specific recombinase XerD